MVVLWPAAQAYWGDVAYLAERVLTTGELKAFVDANAAKPEPLADPGQVIPVNQLRSLLARRLMRDGRYDEAPTYFDRLDDNAPNTQADAIALAQALRRSRQAFWASGRAQAGCAARSGALPGKPHRTRLALPLPLPCGRPGDASRRRAAAAQPGLCGHPVPGIALNAQQPCQ